MTSHRPPAAGTTEAVAWLLVPAALLAAADIRFSIGGQGLFTISPFEAWCYLLLVALLSSIALGRLPRQWLQASRWLLFYIAWATGPALLNPMPADGYPILFDFKILIAASIVHLSIMAFARRETDVGVLCTAWIVAGLINLALALLQYRFGGPYPVALSETAAEKLTWEGEAATHLVTGFFGHPNMLAHAILPWFVVTGARALQSGSKTRGRVGMAVVALAFAAGMAATASKGPVPWALAGIGVAVGLERFPRLRHLGLLAMTWGLLVVGITIGGVVLALQFNATSFQTILPRLALLLVSFDLFKDHLGALVTGGGLTFWNTYSQALGGWQFYNAHNVYVNQILMYGLVGLGLLLGFLGAVLKRALRATGIGALSPYPYVGAIFATTGSYFFEPSFSQIVIKHQVLLACGLALLTVRFSAGPHEPADPEKLEVAHQAGGTDEERG